MGTFVAKGIDVIGNPTINAQSGGSGGGRITLNGGTQLWPDDAVIEFTTVRETANGELNGNSGFTGIKVYANFGAFRSGTPLYTYGPQNPGQTAGVQGDLSGLGDSYVRFNANVLVSTDPAAPRLGGLFVSPGSNAGDRIGTLTTPRRSDFDFNEDGRIRGPLENGNGLFFPGLSDLVYICFARGTRIATTGGEMAVEQIGAGTRVMTRDNGAQTVLWAGSRRIRAMGSFALRPVRIAAGALGDGLPSRDLVLSPNHRVLVAGADIQIATGETEALAAAKHLTHLPGISQPVVTAVIYVHLMFAHHEVVLSNGLWSESFQPGSIGMSALDQPQRDEVLACFPALAAEGPAVPAARRILRSHEARLVGA